MSEALRACDAVRNLGPLMGDGGEQEEVSGNRGNGNAENGNGGNGNEGNGNGGNRNRGDGNGNGNGRGYGYNFRGFMPARECTCQDFLKCQPLNFNRTEGVVGLTYWFEKMETVFHIRNYTEKYQVKYALCTLLNNALTSWNSHKRTIGIKAAYAISWVELMKLMIKVYCPRNEGNVIAAEPIQLQDAIRIANNLMDQRLKGYARSAENKRRDCKVTVNSNTQRALTGSQHGIVYYECGRPRHFRKDCPKLRNQNRGNNNGNKTENQTESNEATTRA
nr:hypothetical protein [Tanacetum cinerariifolium]